MSSKSCEDETFETETLEEAPDSSFISKDSTNDFEFLTKSNDLYQAIEYIFENKLDLSLSQDIVVQNALAAKKTPGAQDSIGSRNLNKDEKLSLYTLGIGESQRLSEDTVEENKRGVEKLTKPRRNEATISYNHRKGHRSESFCSDSTDELPLINLPVSEFDTQAYFLNSIKNSSSFIRKDLSMEYLFQQIEIERAMPLHSQEDLEDKSSIELSLLKNRSNIERQNVCQNSTTVSSESKISKSVQCDIEASETAPLHKNDEIMCKFRNMIYEMSAELILSEKQFMEIQQRCDDICHNNHLYKERINAQEKQIAANMKTIEGLQKKINEKSNCTCLHTKELEAEKKQSSESLESIPPNSKKNLDFCQSNISTSIFGTISKCEEDYQNNSTKHMQILRAIESEKLRLNHEETKSKLSNDSAQNTLANAFHKLRSLQRARRNAENRAYRLDDQAFDAQDCTPSFNSPSTGQADACKIEENHTQNDQDLLVKNRHAPKTSELQSIDKSKVDSHEDEVENKDSRKQLAEIARQDWIERAQKVAEQRQRQITSSWSFNEMEPQSKTSNSILPQEVTESEESTSPTKTQKPSKPQTNNAKQVMEESHPNKPLKPTNELPFATEIASQNLPAQADIFEDRLLKINMEIDELKGNLSQLDRARKRTWKNIQMRASIERRLEELQHDKSSIVLKLKSCVK